MGVDLFWGIRGGGSDRFGVVVSWKVKLVPVSPTVTVFSLLMTVNMNATQLVYCWQHIADELPDDLFVRLILRSYNSAPNWTRTIQAIFNILCQGTAHDLLQVMNASFPKLGLTKQDCEEMSQIESILYFAGFQNGKPLEVVLNRRSNTKTFKNKSDYVRQPIPVKVLEGMWERFFQKDQAVPQMIWISYGWKMSRISGSAIPFPHRAGNIYMIQHMTAWTSGGNEDSPRHMSWIRKFYEYVAPYVSKSPWSAYINYWDLDIGTNYNGNATTYREASAWGKKYFGNNFDRLVKVKTRFDPSNSSGMNRAFLHSSLGIK